MSVRRKWSVLACALFLAVWMPGDLLSQVSGDKLELNAGDVQIKIENNPFRFGFYVGQQRILGPDSQAGILIDGASSYVLSNSDCLQNSCSLKLQTGKGAKADLEIRMEAHHVLLKLLMDSPGREVRFQTGGAAPGYGLADHAFLKEHYDTDITGIEDNHFLSGEETSRLVSNFIIYPQQDVAVLLVDPTPKVIHSSRQQIVQGVEHASRVVNMYYFFGDPHEIYAEYRRVRQQSGYEMLAPKAALFGVGWEAFGALGWKSDEETVRQSIDKYLALGYPLQYAVIGSGFWPEGRPYEETTSFGLFNSKRYPGPGGLIRYLHSRNLKVLFGLRICFLVDGPYTEEGKKNHYFLENQNGIQLFHGGWPKSPYYLLDVHKPEALEWYLHLVDKWLAFGVDGFKEDYFDFGAYALRDDKVDLINNRLMAMGVYLIERNGYLSSNGDLQRINDFNFDQNQDRGPINALAFAYAGFPLVYPDIVGGTFGEEHFSTKRTPRMERYMMRNARWAALHSSMSMGEPPWSFENSEVGKMMLASAQLHDRLQPYIYAQALRFSQDGYPWPLTPLPIAFPHDPSVYGRENQKVRGYEWLIGDSLLATPLYGNDYETAETRDIYLPQGRWMDYDTGEFYDGGRVLHNFSLPVSKDPLFVGGPGIVLEKIKGEVVARIYPLQTRAQESFQLSPQGPAISIETSCSNWNHSVRVEDRTSGQEVPWARERYAIQFPVVTGHHYVVQSAP